MLQDAVTAFRHRYHMKCPLALLGHYQRALRTGRWTSPEAVPLRYRLRYRLLEHVHGLIRYSTATSCSTSLALQELGAVRFAASHPTTSIECVLEVGPQALVEVGGTVVIYYSALEVVEPVAQQNVAVETLGCRHLYRVVKRQEFIQTVLERLHQAGFLALAPRTVRPSVAVPAWDAWVERDGRPCRLMASAEMLMEGDDG